MANRNVNKNYEYTNQMIGEYSGGTWYSGLGNAPHPVATKESDPLNPSSSGDTITDLSAITIGGPFGLNN